MTTTILALILILAVLLGGHALGAAAGEAVVAIVEQAVGETR